MTYRAPLASAFEDTRVLIADHPGVAASEHSDALSGPLSVVKIYQSASAEAKLGSYAVIDLRDSRTASGSMITLMLLHPNSKLYLVTFPDDQWEAVFEDEDNEDEEDHED